MVNDLGGSPEGTGSDATPAEEVVAEIQAAGGEAIANHDDVTDFDAAKRAGRLGGRDLRRPARAGEQRRHPARPDAHQHDRGGVGRRHQGAPQGSLRPDAPRRRLLAGAGQGRRAGQRLGDQHVVDLGPVRQRRPDQLRRRQDGHRRPHDHRCRRARSLRRAGQRHRAGGAHPAHPGPRRGQLAAGAGGSSSIGWTRPTSRRGSPTSPPRAARSPVARSSCTAATWSCSSPSPSSTRIDEGGSLEPRGAGRAGPAPRRAPVRPRQPVVDCDPGWTTRSALAVAAHRCELVGVVSGGRATSASTTPPPTPSALAQLLELDERSPCTPERRDRSSARPATRPLVHGESGLAGAALPPITRSVASEDGAGFLVEASRAHDDLWVIAIGPLTNVATAIQRDPGFASRLAGISIMGGGTVGNATAAAEFNVFADPEAAEIVLESGASLVMCGLDVTRQLHVTPGDGRRGRRAAERLRPVLRRLPPGLPRPGPRPHRRQRRGGPARPVRRPGHHRTRSSSDPGRAGSRSSATAATPAG